VRFNHFSAQWGVEDPALLAHRYLKTRISLFINLPLKSLDQLTLGARLRETGQTWGAACRRPHLA
jgi:hypothetical protein